MHPAEQRALGALDTKRLISDLAELVSFRSLGGEETPVQERMADLLAEAVWTWIDGTSTWPR